MGRLGSYMEKVSIVILNYLNYQDTIECIDSIFKMEYEVKGIVIVDNHSENESFQVLKKKYRNHKNIVTVRTGCNYGFAKGNNIGIAIARNKFETDFVFVVNNDTIFKEKDYFIKLLDCYTVGIGAIGSEIHLKDGIVQQEITYDISLNGSLRNAWNLYLSKIEKNVWSFLWPAAKKSQKVKVLHGCAILLTPDFFKHYRGFYAGTFLYHEEPILYLMCKRCGLRQRYVKDTYIDHKEDRSSEMSFQNNSLVMNTYLSQSSKFFLWWIVKDKVNGIVKRFLKIPNENVVYESVVEGGCMK